MPESPEVQALAEFLNERASGRTITSVDVLEFRTIKTRAAPPESLVGSEITGAQRFGKHLDLAVGGRHLGVSLGRHGWARWSRPDQPAPEGAPPALAVLSLDDGSEVSLTDAGSWVSLGLFVVDEPRDVPAVAKLGPDPADPAFAQADLDAVTVGRRKQLKAVLQEQESLAGIGNAYSDEILHLAKLSPVVHAAALDERARERLFDATTSTIRGAITARRGIPIDQLKSAKVASMRVHGRAGEVCSVCGDTVRSFSFGSTTAEYCPTCQTDGALLGADG
ncbi:DNA-formamidopyrimidine glycosylase family protein [Microbacterium sp.]|uniref:DNA-formamidopyrimidine glycosylase family protein n=1 Tax=Microbacterium sp. TaxID=51671 RepID=UPI003F6F0482